MDGAIPILPVYTRVKSVGRPMSRVVVAVVIPPTPPPKTRHGMNKDSFTFINFNSASVC
jgi:hypothetical protein